MHGQGDYLDGDDRLKRLSDLGSSGLVMDVDVAAGAHAAADLSNNPPAAPAEALEQVLRFLTSDERAAIEGASPTQSRDLRAALELAGKVFEVVRAADERVAAAEEFQRQLVDTHSQQVDTFEARIAASDRRTKAAEARAKEAEAWLARFHDNIVEDFKRTFASRAPHEASRPS